MEWLKQLEERENKLRRTIRSLLKAGSKVKNRQGLRVLFRVVVLPEVEQMQARIAECLRGRSDEEQDRLRYLIQLRLPLCCKLSAIYGLKGTQADWPVLTGTGALR